MKTKLTTIFKKSANTPPMWVCLLFAWFLLPFNVNAGVTAIGTGTVTLNCGNVTSTTGEETTTWTNASSSGACCLYMYGGDGTAKSYWDVTIQPGTYDIQLHYGTINYGITARFDLLLASNDSQVMEIHNQPGYWTTPVNFYVTKEDVNLTSLNGSTTYRVQAANTYGGGGSHFVVEYIKFIRKDGCVTPETASFVAGSGDVTGSVDDVEICAGAEFTMPSSGSMVYPGYMFTGWKLDNAGELITAGTSYTMPAGGASFTAQWVVDNVSLRVPSVHSTLSASNYSRTTGSVVENGYDVDGDKGLDTYLNLQGGKNAEWDVYLEPGTYNITVKSCVDVYGIDVTYTLYDPAGVDATQTIHTYHQTGTGSTIRNVTTVTKDLSSLTANKRYVVKVEDTWDGGCHLRVKDITFTKLGANYAISFAKGDESVTGSLPANTTCAVGGTYTLPALGNLARTGYKFTGWSDGSNTYAPGASYTMPSSDVTFTAQWQAVLVTDFEAEKSGNYNVSLTWSIPGICDLSSPIAPKYQNNVDPELVVYSPNAEGNYVTASGNAGPDDQYGVAFAIPTTQNIEWLSFEYRGVFASNVNLWGGLCDAEDGANAYWQMQNPMTIHPNDAENWASSGELRPNIGYWNANPSSLANPLTQSISQVAVYANASGSKVTGISFDVRNVRYHVYGQEDIHHIVVMRNVDSAPADTTDGVKLYSGTKSYFNDNAEKAAGTYYYAIFAVYNDVSRTVSSPVVADPIVIESAKVDPELTVSVDKGAISTSGSATLTVSTAGAYTGTLSYDVSPTGIISLEGSTITAVAAGSATITVSAPATAAHYADNKSVTVTVIAPPTTNLAIDGVDGDNVTLTWDVPGKIDLSTWSLSSDYLYSPQNPTSSDKVSYDPATEELTVSYVGSYGSQNGVAFPFELGNVETVSYDYIGYNVFPMVVKNGSRYFGGVPQGDYVEWHSESVSPNTKYWSQGDKTISDPSKAISICANPETEPYSRTFRIRNVFYHCTGMTDIDHIVIRRTTSAPATNITDGDAIYSGKMSHFVDTDTKAAGFYYYTLFAVYENGSIPVESVTLDTRVFNITYKDKGDAEFSGTHETGYPTSHNNGAATALKKATKDNYAFVGWYDNAACTGDAVTSLAAGAYDADITLYARWEELSLHQPGKYQAPDGYGRVLKNINGHDYEVYMVTYDTIETEHYGALYAGPVAKISDGYRMFRMEKKWDVKESIKGDGWVEFNAYKYEGSESSCNINEFQQLNQNSGIYSSQYARLKSTDYVQMYVQGYAEFAFIGNDYNNTGDNFIVRIDGKEATPSPNPYEASTSTHVTRYALTPSNEPHFIEITGSSSNTNKFRGFSLQLPDVERYTVTVARNDNSYGSVSAASITNVRTGEATYVSDNTVYIAGTTVTATPAVATSEYTYAFDNWSGIPANITAATTVTANFTRTANDFTLTWDLNGGTVTTAGTGAAVNATGTPSSSVAYGTAITVPVLEKAGSDFIGWDITPAATMPAENVTYTAKWYAPVVIPSGTTHLDANNYYPYTIAAKAPSESSFNVDGEGDAEKCLDISNNHYAEWQAKIAQGYYQVTMLYGTTGYAVNVNLKVIDPSTNPETVICTTTTDVHSDGSGNHCCYQAKWGVDLRGIDDDPDKLYLIRVEDVYGGTGSHPQIGYVDFEPATPTTLSGTVPTYLDHNNVTSAYRITPFDIDNDGNNETCVFIGDQNQAEWLIKINPAYYNVRVRYGKASGGVKLNLYLIDADGVAVWTSDQRVLSSGTRYETWEINGLNLLDDYSSSEEYLLRIKDTYGSNGSTPNIEYIEFVPKVVHTRSGLHVGDYGTVCLPYAIASEDIQGADIFDMQGWPAGSVAVVLNEVDEMEAGRPYIYQATASTATWSYYPESDPVEAGQRNGLIGSYTKEVVTANDNNYIIYDNKLYFVDVLAYVGANKAYINRTLAEEAGEPSAPALGKRQIHLYLNGAQVVTGIDQLNDQSQVTKFMENGILYIIRDGKIYNAQGQLVK